MLALLKFVSFPLSNPTVAMVVMLAVGGLMLLAFAACIVLVALRKRVRGGLVLALTGAFAQLMNFWVDRSMRFYHTFHLADSPLSMAEPGTHHLVWLGSFVCMVLGVGVLAVAAFMMDQHWYLRDRSKRRQSVNGKVPAGMH